MKRLEFAVVTLLLQLAVCDEYFWLHNSNWDEPNNWSLGRVPCGGQNVSFAATPPNSLIYVKTNVTVRRILLPTNGKIILKPSVTIRFSEQSSCAVEGSPPMAVDVQNEFIGASRRHDWKCAENWVRSGNRPAIHPPCGRDTAIFKPDSAYSFVTSNRSVTVSSLTVRGVQLQSLSNLTDPRSEFKLDVTINKDCMRDSSLCPCPSQAGCRDACARGIDDCHPNATCVPKTRGGYYCRCNPGFEGDGQQCNDSCDPSLHHCGPNSTCVHRSNGYFECPCDPGFIGNGRDGCIAGDKPMFLFQGTTYQNNSLVTLEKLGEGDSGLYCITNDTDCCTKAFIRENGVDVFGNWYYPNGTRVASEGEKRDFYRNRGLSMVHLCRRRGGDVGIYRCQLPYVTNDTAYLYIGVYTASTGSPSVTNLTYNNQSRTLTCISTGGPATTVTWRRNGVVITLSATYHQTKHLVDPVNGTYRTVLTIDSSVGPSGFVGNYNCTVENIRGTSSKSVFVDACTYGFYDCHPNATCVPETNGLYRCHCKPGFEGDGRQCTDSCDPSLHPCGPNSTCVHRSNGDTECPCDPGFIGNGEDGCIAGDKPMFSLSGTAYQNNSLVTMEDMGQGDNTALLCLTNDTDCCTKAFIRENGVGAFGNWYYPNGSRVSSIEVHERAGVEWDFYRTRGLSVVRLHRRRGGHVGIYRCQLPYVTNDTAYLYIGVYTASTGSPSVTSLTYNNQSRTLTCISTGGPATAVTWKRNGVVITLGATHQQTKRLVDPVNGTYQTVLTIDSSVGPSGFVGNYNCTVENIRGTSSKSVFVGSPSVTSLTYNNRSRTLTCTTTGGPATAVTWKRNGVVITHNAHQQTKSLVDRIKSTYRTVLTIGSSVLAGNYSCSVGLSSKSVVVTVPVVPIPPSSESNVGGVAAGVGVLFVVLIIAVIIIIVGVVIYRRRKRGSYTKDDLLDPGDDLRPDKPNKPDRSSEGVSFDNPLYVASNEDDMLELIGSELTAEAEPDDTEPDDTEPGDTEDHTNDGAKVDVSLN